MQQLDIFADSVPVQRANDLIAALCNFNHIASQQALQRLFEADPQHSGMMQFHMLCNFVNRWFNSDNTLNRLCTSNAIAAEEQLIREQIIPAATVLEKAKDTWIRQCWNILAKASAKANIPPEHPHIFGAELYLRAQQYQATLLAAKNISGADFRASAQRWLSLGYHGCGETTLAMRSMVRYAWLAPEKFNAFVEEVNSATLTLEWNNFQTELYDLDANWFPAWCAHEKLFELIMLDNLPENDGGLAYRLVMGLAIRERGGLGPAVYKDRARLKRLNENFFEFYMKRR